MEEMTVVEILREVVFGMLNKSARLKLYNEPVLTSELEYIKDACEDLAQHIEDGVFDD